VASAPFPDIAWLTPYAAQARLIRRTTRRLNRLQILFIEVSPSMVSRVEKRSCTFSLPFEVTITGPLVLQATGAVSMCRLPFPARTARLGNDQTLRRDPDTDAGSLADAYGLNTDNLVYRVRYT
jgi:hypothetical protein